MNKKEKIGMAVVGILFFVFAGLAGSADVETANQLSHVSIQ